MMTEVEKSNVMTTTQYKKRIKTPPRKCKGVNLANGFESCGEKKIHHRFGLCSSCFGNWLFQTEAGEKYMEKIKTKAKKEVKKKANQEWKQREATLKEETTNWKDELQVQINKIVRLIDMGLPCLATGRYAAKFDAGHVYARGGNQTIRFNLHNIHRQSAQSNYFQNDDGKLREGIVKEYGQEYMTFISELRRTPALNLKNNEYKELTLKARLIARELIKKDKIYNVHNRIGLRNEVNKELGIYSVEFCNFKET